MNEQTLFDEWNTTVEPQTSTLIPMPEKKFPTSPNPCVDKFGPGPEGKQCKDCRYLQRFHQAATWFHCEKRQWKTKGGKNKGTIYPGGDHRVHYPACAKFEEDKEETS